jgi:ribulose-phosphate 3-epimerase
MGSLWNNPAELKNLETSLKLEAHLMVQNPERVVDDWIASGVKRIIFHYESTRQPEGIIKKVKQAGLEIGLAINPETLIEVVDDFIDQLDLVLVMTVEPGRGGQSFLEESLGKIKQLREKYKDVNIEVDGGVNLETAPKVIQAGANLLASGTAIFKSENIEKTIKELKRD